MTPAAVADLMADALDMPGSVHPPRGRARQDRTPQSDTPPPARTATPAPAANARPMSGGLAPLPGETLSGSLVGKIAGRNALGRSRQRPGRAAVTATRNPRTA